MLGNSIHFPENDKETPDAKINTSENDANYNSNLDTKDDSEDKSDESSEGNADVKANDKTKEKGKSFAYVPRELEKAKQLQKAIEIMLAMDASKQRLLENQ